MAQLTRPQVADALGKYYSAKFGGHVWATYDASKRKYEIRGEGLPAIPDLRHLYPRGWSLLSYVSPSEARELIGKEG